MREPQERWPLLGPYEGSTYRVEGVRAAIESKVARIMSAIGPEVGTGVPR